MTIRTAYVPLLIGAVPLLIYPIVFLASVMSLGAHRSGDEPLLLMVVFAVFLMGALAYPIVYGVCAWLTVVRVTNDQDDAARRVATFPLWYLGALVLVGAAWAGLE